MTAPQPTGDEVRLTADEQARVRDALVGDTVAALRGFDVPPRLTPAIERIIAARTTALAAENERLRGKVARVEALVERLTWKRPDVCPCVNPEECCGSEESCDAMRPMTRIVSADTIRAALGDQP